MYKTITEQTGKKLSELMTLKLEVNQTTAGGFFFYIKDLDGWTRVSDKRVFNTELEARNAGEVKLKEV